MKRSVPVRTPVSNVNVHSNLSSEATMQTASATPPVPVNPSPQPPTTGLATCLALIAQAQQAFDSTDPPGIIPPAQKKRMLKMPTKGATQVPGLAKLWQDYGGTLAAVDLSKMEAELAHASDVRKVAKDASELWLSLEDDALVSESAAWTAATQIYTVLQAAARTNGTLAVALEPYAKYFSEGAQTHRVNKKNGVPTKKEQRAARKRAEAIALLAGDTPPKAAPAPADKPVTPKE